MNNELIQKLIDKGCEIRIKKDGDKVRFETRLWFNNEEYAQADCLNSLDEVTDVRLECAIRGIRHFHRKQDKLHAPV